MNSRVSGSRRRPRSVLAAAAAALLLAAPAAFGAELTREQYVGRVEPICKRDTEANSRIFAGAKAEVRSGKLKQAAARFQRAEIALGKAIGQIDGVPKPAADEARLEKWIGYLQSEQGLLGRIGTALAQGEKGKAQSLAVRLRRNANLANNTVLPFGFTYCRLDPSRFS
jgi:hypothetical protein